MDDEFELGRMLEDVVGSASYSPQKDAAVDVGMLPEPSGVLSGTAVSQPSSYTPFSDWTEDSQRRLNAQMQAMRLLQAGQNVPVSTMLSAGGQREFLTRCVDLDPTPPLESMPRKMEWFRKATQESFWTLPPHLQEDLAALESAKDSCANPGAGQRTLAGERRWRAEQRMRQAEEQLGREYKGVQGRAEAHPTDAGAGTVTNSSSQRREMIDLLSLRLRCIQRRLRASVAEAHPLSGLPSAGVLRFIQRDVELEGDEEASMTPEDWESRKKDEQAKTKAERHARHLERVIAAQESFQAHFRLRRETMKRLCKEIEKAYQKKERRKQAQMDKEKKDRLAALKSDDIAAYRKHIQDSKNERMKLVVGRMDEYMEKLGASIYRQTADAAAAAGQEAGQDAATEYTFHLPINEKITEQSSLLGAREGAGGEGGGGREDLKLKAYQLEGVNWMVNLYNNNMSGILADEMGLGKTIQVIGMICHLIEHKSNPGPYLVIAPLSTISNWQSEFDRWAPSLKVIVYKGNPSERKDLFTNQMKDGTFNVTIVQFELVMDAKDAKRLKSLHWSHIIVDEGHRLRNRESKLFTMLTGKNGYRSTNRLILSGTPLQNEIHELWSLLNFLLPEVFETNDDFEEWFAKPFKMQDDTNDFEVEDEEKEFLIKCLHAVLRPFMTRRLKADLKDIMDLPQTREVTIWCELSALQKILYLQTENHLLMQQDADGGAKQKKMSNRIAQLRKVCNHPFLFEEYDFGNEYLIRSCGKLALLDRILPKLQRGGHRVLVYSQMVKLLSLLKFYCEIKGYRHMVLSGETASDDRIAMMQKWNAPNSEYFIFMLSTRAGGQGINLQTADTVIIYDSDWNPMMDEQAKARVHRLGQKKQTLILRLVTPNTVEEKVTKRAQARLQNEDLAIEAGKFNQRTEVAESHEILKQKLAKELQDQMDKVKEQAHTDEQINELIARTPEEIDLFNKMDEEERAREDKRVGGGGDGPQPRLMTDREIPAWLQGDPIFKDDRVLVLSDRTSADLVVGDGQTGIVEQVPCAANPHFVVRLDGAPDNETKSFPRSQLRPMTHEAQDRYRQELGYGRGQRESRQVSHNDRVDFSKMTDKQFDKHMRESDMAEDQEDAAKKKKRDKKRKSKEGADGEGAASPASPAPADAAASLGGRGHSPALVQGSAKKAKVSIPRKCDRKKGAGADGHQGAWSGVAGAAASSPASPGLAGHQCSPDIVRSRKSGAHVGSEGRDTENDRSGAGAAGRHAKYDANAKPPWRGGDVKPFLYGRKVVFVLKGQRQPPLYR